VVDLHCHLIPAIDDGPADVDASLRMVQVALREGIDTIVATPHVDLRYRVDPEEIAGRVEALSAAVAREQLPLTVLPGAEVALTRLGSLDDAQLRASCLGGSSYVLVESPYLRAGELIEGSLFDLQVRGFRPLLAHPERCPEFQHDLARLERLVAYGVACSVDAGSIVGQFGRSVRRFAVRLLRENLVHNLSSDAHDAVNRPPALRTAFGAAQSSLPGIASLQDWLTSAVPAAIVADEPLPPRPAMPTSPPSTWRRLRGRA
jgi:protein-tyrosine phosphatase